MGMKYTEEFKQDALRMCEQEGVSKTGERLGVSVKTLYGWQRAQRHENGSPNPGQRPYETVEQTNRRLLRENAELREANQILKKAMGFMAGR